MLSLYLLLHSLCLQLQMRWASLSRTTDFTNLKNAWKHLDLTLLLQVCWKCRRPRGSFHPPHTLATLLFCTGPLLCQQKRSVLLLRPWKQYTERMEGSLSNKMFLKWQKKGLKPTKKEIKQWKYDGHSTNTWTLSSLMFYIFDFQESGWMFLLYVFILPVFNGVEESFISKLIKCQTLWDVSGLMTDTSQQYGQGLALS